LRSLSHNAIRIAAIASPYPIAGATAMIPKRIKTAAITGNAMTMPRQDDSDHGDEQRQEHKKQRSDEHADDEEDESHCVPDLSCCATIARRAL